MITRLVKMTFLPGKENEFLELFSLSKEKIRNSEGCTHLELLRDTARKNVFFTYSRWNSAADLERYRNSALFKEVWSSASRLFSEKAEAWSTEKY